MSPTSHLIFRGSGRHGEDYEVQDRTTGERLGCMVQDEAREWMALDLAGRASVNRRMCDAALNLWPAGNESAKS
jgi:hypothetical protein